MFKMSAHPITRASTSDTASKGECCSSSVVNDLAQLAPPMLDLLILRIAGRLFCVWQGVYTFVTVVNQGWI